MDNVESTNINSMWIQNVYENIKNLENLERLAREGCQTLMDYLQIPYDQRDLIVPDIMYKNLKFIITEFTLLLTDISLMIDPEKLKDYDSYLKKLQEDVKIKKRFIKEYYNAQNNSILKIEPTQLFYATLNVLTMMRRSILYEIKDILWLPETKGGAKEQAQHNF